MTKTNIVLAALLLGSCGERLHWTQYNADEAYDLADTANANARTALMRIESLSSRVGDESGSDLGSDIRMLRARIDDLESSFNSLRQTVNNNADAYNQHIRGGAQTN